MNKDEKIIPFLPTRLIVPYFLGNEKYIMPNIRSFYQCKMQKRRFRLKNANFVLIKGHTRLSWAMTR